MAVAQNQSSVYLITVNVLEHELTDPNIPPAYRECLLSRLQALKDPPPPKLAAL